MIGIVIELMNELKEMSEGCKLLQKQKLFRK